jgi:hypothetical protein
MEFVAKKSCLFGDYLRAVDIVNSQSMGQYVLLMLQALASLVVAGNPY